METLEIGAVRLDAALTPHDAYARFVRPKDEPRLSDFCTRLTSIRQEDADASHPFPEALASFDAWIGQSPARLCSWSRYDLEQLRRDCARHAVELPARLERHLDLQETHARLRRSEIVSMTTAMVGESLSWDGAHHRALDDARNGARLAAKLVAELRERP